MFKRKLWALAAQAEQPDGSFALYWTTTKAFSKFLARIKMVFVVAWNLALSQALFNDKTVFTGPFEIATDAKLVYAALVSLGNSTEVFIGGSPKVLTDAKLRFNLGVMFPGSSVKVSTKLI